jgi:hypothetical protein
MSWNKTADILYCFAAVRNRRTQQVNLHPDIPTRVLYVDFSLLHPMHTPACWGKGANYGFPCYVIIYIFITSFFLCPNNVLGT